MTELKYETLVIKRQGMTRNLPAGIDESLQWVANTATLIYGENDAVLVDTFTTVEQNQALVDWVVASGKNLTTIYITHGHGDHFFGINMLQERFPNARAIATPEAVSTMPYQFSQVALDTFWNKLFPGQIPDKLVSAEALEGNEFELEGHKLVVVDTGFTDTVSTTALHVPSIGLVVAGDAVYNDIHPLLSETNEQTRLDWLAALDRIEALKPTAVIAGHKKPENDDSPDNIGKTRQYIMDFIRLNEVTTTAEDLFNRMMEIYPNRANPGSLWGASNAAKA
ncbi:MBL fold metallo-hydrolase [Paenibacillus brasilensis]|uniref:Glyoxylase-like metal-dependent hydrolase (Beta-lactamase superfamily II) n=1 Tax=Paenibacillus brasilensis TaxID=128574 RepID=A0ABU0L7N7_9BACL|nr:MBL fold metallo-hydrolase [Paenibacillus brasilensis]MDQ0497289.1 glyoxylase-like metal-dependent hydrolase (beta-lactamase superfamily II) [Paenibacillus brasilensis]